MARLLALAAATNLWLKRGSFNGIPGDKLVLVFMSLTCLFALLIGAKEGFIGAWSIFFGTAIVLAFQLWAASHHNVIFRPGYEGSTADGREDVSAYGPVFASGRFILWEGDRTRFARILDRLMSGRRGDRWFLQIPVRLESRPGPLELFSFVSWFDASERLLGIALENKAGMWTITGSFETLGDPVYGDLLLGWKTIEGIRLDFRDERGKRRTAVLTSDSAERVQALHRRLADAVSSRDFEGFRKLAERVTPS